MMNNDQPITKIVGYLRLSRVKKGKNKAQTIESAYGIAAQKAAIEQLAAQHGATIVKWYEEIETGTKKRDRPELKKAISHSQLVKATLVIGKLDRLARNVAFVSKLMESKVDFRCCDNPNATPVLIHILASMAEHEARCISTRTRESLAKAKDAGVLLGSARPGHWEGREDKRGFREANVASAKARHQQAINAYEFLVPTIREMRKGGKSLRDVAQFLNGEGHTTTRGKPFSEVAVRRVVILFKHRTVEA